MQKVSWRVWTATSNEAERVRQRLGIVKGLWRKGGNFSLWQEPFLWDGGEEGLTGVGGVG